MDKINKLKAMYAITGIGCVILYALVLILTA